MKSLDDAPLADAELCRTCRKFRAKFLVWIRGAVEIKDAILCTRCAHKALRRWPDSEATELIETKRGAN